jgi:hypothetical protein
MVEKSTDDFKFEGLTAAACSGIGRNDVKAKLIIKVKILKSNTEICQSFSLKNILSFCSVAMTR